jgi:hypothetical protein
MRKMKTKQQIISLISIAALLLTSGVQLLVSKNAHAAQLDNRSLTLSTSQGSASNVTYTLQFDITSAYVLGSVVLEICEEDPLPNQPCTNPVGFDASGVVLSAQTGQTGFVVDGASTINRIVIGRAPLLGAAGTVNYTFTGISNPDTANKTYYARVYTYASSDGTGTNIDDGGIAFAIANQVGINTEVPPYLLFCVGQTITGFNCATANGNFLDLGELSRVATRASSGQMVTATNAAYGLGITVNGTTLTSGNNTITALVPPQASNTGTPQFGMNLRDNSNPNIGSDPAGLGSVTPTAGYNIPNQFKYVNGETVASTATTSDLKKFTFSFIVNISAGQQPGVYTTTIIFNCLANF